MSLSSTSRFVGVCAVVLLAGAGLPAAQDLPLSRFEGEWVGLQTWTVENPSAREPQPVTLTLQVADGRLTGSMTPFLGNAQAHPLIDVEVVGNELHAKLDSSRSRNRWERDADVSLVFTQQAEELTGTADLKMGEVPWLKLDYALARKRSRY